MDNQEMLMEISKMLEAQEQRFEDKLQNHTRQINLKIENEVTKRIDALFDGYKLTHEKQWEMERMLLSEIEIIKERLAALETA